MTRSDTAAPEHELLAAIAGGDRDAFRELYETSYGKLARYVKNMVTDEGLAEDIIVQTYTVVWQSAARFRGGSRVSTWMIGIARNLALKEFRKQKSAAPFDEAYIGADEKSQRQAEEQDRRKQMKQALAAVSPKQREVLELAFYQGLTYPEIAELIDIPVNTVKTRIFHAKKALRDELAKRGIGEHDI